jgi:hypothetical protein
VATEGDIVIHKAVLANYHDSKDDNNTNKDNKSL